MAQISTVILGAFQKDFTYQAKEELHFKVNKGSLTHMMQVNHQQGSPS